MAIQTSKVKSPARHTTKDAVLADPVPHQAIRRRLQRERAVLLSGDGRIVTPGPDVGESGDQLDRALVGVECELTMRMKARRWEALRRVDGALRRLGTRGYGLCEDCGTRIPAKRLRVRPEATRCVHCQARHEDAAMRPDSLLPHGQWG